MLADTAPPCTLPPTFASIILASASLDLITVNRMPPLVSDAGRCAFYQEIERRAVLAVQQGRLELNQVIPLTTAIANAT